MGTLFDRKAVEPVEGRVPDIGRHLFLEQCLYLCRGSDKIGVVEMGLLQGGVVPGLLGRNRGER